MAGQARRLQRVPEELSQSHHPICIHSGTGPFSAVYSYCLCRDWEEA